MSTGDWWDYSWNVAPGCTKVGPECAHCWAEAMARRLQGMKKAGYAGLIDAKGRWSGRVNLLEDKLEAPLKLKRPRVIAVNLMGDLFHPQVSFEFVERVFATMAQADWHTYMVLTKRAERAVEFVKGAGHWNRRMPNVWIGTSAGTQRSANERWSAMAWLAEAGWTTWVSSEPRLERIDWHGWRFLRRLVTGGESGPYARPMAPVWARSDRDWCEAHGVEFWFKQWGEWAPDGDGRSSAAPLQNYPVATMAGELVFRFGRKLAGRELDGRVHGGE